MRTGYSIILLVAVGEWFDNGSAYHKRRYHSLQFDLPKAPVDTSKTRYRQWPGGINI